MDEASVAHNSGQSPVAGAAVNSFSAQEHIAAGINRLVAATVCHWWKLMGDDPNSLCRFLDVPWSNLRLILRKCNILYGPNDSFRTEEFENLMRCADLDCTRCRPTGKVDYFLQIGDRREGKDSFAVNVPKEMYGLGGVLEKWPVAGVHLPGMRTKQSRRLFSTLLNLSAASLSAESPAAEEHSDKPNNKGTMTIYVNDLLEVIKNEIVAAQQGQYSYSQRAERMLRKATVKAIKGSVRAFVDTWVDRIGNMKEKEVEECLSTPTIIRRATLLSSGNETECPSGQAGNNHISNNTAIETQVLVTPPLNLTTINVDDDEDERDIDIVLSNVKEQTILQNLLHKRLLNKSQRSWTVEHKNGRKLRVIIPPDTQTAKAFVEEAKKTRWVSDMLSGNTHLEGMLLYLAQHHAADYVRVAEEKKIRITSEVLNTPQTMALGRLARINDTQMYKLRSFLRHVGKVDLKLSEKEISRIDRDVGLCHMPEAIYNTFTFEWSTTRSNEKKPPEICSYWNSDLSVEVAAEIDMVLQQMFLEKPGLRTVPSLDYIAPGFDNIPGITVLFGGDHGQGSCPCSLKLNLSSPQERKARGELNYRCPTIQIASIDCTKDTLELLSNTIMPQIKAQLIQLRNSSVFVVYSVSNPGKHRKAFLFPKTLQPSSFRIQHNLLVYNYSGLDKSIDLSPYFNNEQAGFSYSDLRVCCVVSNFHDLYVGDLAFLSMAIGMNNSSGAHCILCKKKAKQFNCDLINAEEVRTKASLTQCLNEFNRLRQTNRSVNNHCGVNTVGLLDIDPQRIIVPILHCPMGLVDKVLTAFKDWTVFEVEQLPANEEALRQAYKNATIAYRDSIAFEDSARQLDMEAGNTVVSMALLQSARTARAKAKSEETKAKQVYDEMVKKHNARVYSCSQEFDVIFRSHKVKKEHYHGGKCNGVNCIPIMENAVVLFTEFAAAIISKKIPTKTNNEIEEKCRQFARLLSLLDIIWSNVRGVDAGLLPTEDQINQLRTALTKAKATWLSMNVGTRQPKWHLTFDGHLLQQVIKHGGLADKSDDTIEFQHQLLMKLRDRYRSITSYQRKETCIRKELRRQKSPEITRIIDQHQQSIKKDPSSKRQLDFTERKQEQRDTKKAKRDAVLDDE